MEIRTKLQDWLLECGNIHFSIEVVDDKSDDSPYLFRMDYEDETQCEYWLQESDLNQMIRIMNRAKRERKRLTGE